MGLGRRVKDFFSRNKNPAEAEEGATGGLGSKNFYESNNSLYEPFENFNRPATEGAAGGGGADYYGYDDLEPSIDSSGARGVWNPNNGLPNSFSETNRIEGNVPGFNPSETEEPLYQNFNYGRAPTPPP